MEKTLKEIAGAVSGEIVGDPSLKIKNVSNIEEARPGDLTFLLDNKFTSQVGSSKASAVIVPKDAKGIDKPHIKVSNPRSALAKVLKMFEPAKTFKKEIHKTAVVASTAKVSKSASIMPYVCIGEGTTIGDNAVIFPGSFIGDNCKIGDGTIIHSNVSIYDRTEIGKRCIVHSGTVVGSDGFGFAPVGEGWEKIPQLGNVVIEDDVELNANVAIARGTMGSTIIKRGTKIDNLTHVAHNCVIGEGCTLTSLIAIAGSSTLGKHVMMGGNSAVSDHVNIGDNTIVMAKAGVIKDTPPGSVVSGFPARDHKKQLEIQAAMSKLPDILKKISEKLK
ncbi:UDP-3-O-(3-hydroxymyristoyl)glucosamine N-acyltransferase [Candidatus Margulisiibacteriota bacterium]